MANYLITREELMKLGISEQEREKLERIFNYTTYSDMEMELENRDIEYNENLLEACEDVVLTKFDDDRAFELVEFLIYMGRIKSE